MLKSKAKFFKTLFIRYNSKSNEILDKEVSEMVNNLRHHGSKMSAKTKTIENQILKAFESFNNVRNNFKEEENMQSLQTDQNFNMAINDSLNPASLKDFFLTKKTIESNNSDDDEEAK
jgi:hypothetical protein